MNTGDIDTEAYYGEFHDSSAYVVAGMQRTDSTDANMGDYQPAHLDPEFDVEGGNIAVIKHVEGPLET